MADIHNYDFLNELRRRRIFDRPDEDQTIGSNLSPMPEMPQDQPQVQPQAQAPQLDLKEPAHPAYDAYLKKLSESPTEAQHPSSKLRKVLGALAGGSVGFFGDPKSGAAVTRSIQDAPYLEAQKKFHQELDPLAAQAKLEAENRKAELENVLKKSQAYRYTTQAQSDLANAGEKQFNISPEAHKRKIEEARARPFSPGSGLLTTYTNGEFKTDKVGPTTQDVAETRNAGNLAVANVNQSGANTRNEATNKAMLERAMKVADAAMARTKYSEGQQNSRASLNRALHEKLYNQGITSREKMHKDTQDRIKQDRESSQVTPAKVMKAREASVQMLVQNFPEFKEFGYEDGKLAPWNPGWLTKDSKIQSHERFLRMLESMTNNMLQSTSDRTVGMPVGPPKGSSRDESEPFEDNSEENIFK